MQPLVRGDPGSRLTLRGRDLGVRHLLGNLLAVRDCILAALHRREVEPFMRGNEIDEAGTAAGPIHATLEQHVRQRARVDRRRHTQIESPLKHVASPLLLCRLVPASAAPVQTVQLVPMPIAGLLGAIMASKFEWQFKYRDEGDVNACIGGTRAKMQEVSDSQSLLRFVGFGLRRRCSDDDNHRAR